MESVLTRCESLADALVDSLGAVNLAQLDIPSLRRHLLTLQRTLDRVTVAQARALHYGQHYSLFAGSGARSMADWMCRATGAAYGETAGKVRLADTLNESSALSAAVEAGEVSPATARVLFDAVSCPPEGADVADLVDRVRGADPRAARAEIDAWRAEHTTETDDERALRCYHARSLVFDPPTEGMVTGTFRLAVADATQVQATIAYLGGKPSEGDARTTAQRYADGLLLLCDAYAKGQVRGGRERPTIVFTTSVDKPDASRRETTAGEAARVAREPATSSLGTRIDAATLSRLAEDATVQHLTHHGTAIVSLSTPERFATDAQWKALVARDGGCVVDNCHIPAAWCDIDHIVPAQHGGTTTLDNLSLKCRHHHTLKHLPGVTETGDGHGGVITLADGTQLICRPHGTLAHAGPSGTSKSTAA